LRHVGEIEDPEMAHGRRCEWFAAFGAVETVLVRCRGARSGMQRAFESEPFAVT